MDRRGWRRAATIVGYGLGVALVVAGLALGEPALALAGLVLLAILVLTTDG